MSDALLELSDVSVTIDSAPVLSGVSLRVDPGETVALVGRNGAGKTTTFRTVMGQTDMTDGSIRMSGTEIADMKSRERSRMGIGFAPEDRRLFTSLTVEDNLRMATWGGDSIPESEFEERLDRILDIFPEMEEFLDRPAGQLSGGQQKMVTVGRALSSDPELVLVDEPFEGLAPSVREQFRNGLERIKDLDVSIVVAESNVRHAGEVADRAYVIERGEIITDTDITEEDPLEENEEVRRIFEGG
ncbi:ABC-type transport system ATP-binding protein (probable substrate branched-chain amino acids) [Natronomonas pharaonis DSM 2160]|uniref:ABC-type transport system ATP-binding protein (Probable substrate branched-chain amino acids) n=1 Tax=Natronomonas pharaonis (strain ATCC 35678 / DSM 2160 / CIP 103997 / JCM 8858 / NBRC 14720 / NCIMB 2260 / Gabara) TaxID=348780 RepID=A0A1U7EXC4_NATPD|nr:ABC transporter ATP-binding protein [Natronomonas pharaonis]CAI49807.1 ABC-type transport system ATP-binding protein (probable substrate branched-chain amino acids) [Natronomonas pharaonis DSM 2160]